VTAAPITVTLTLDALDPDDLAALCAGDGGCVLAELVRKAVEDEEMAASDATMPQNGGLHARS
jgi:hypothetical protein